MKSKRLKRFQNCKHKRVQEFSEICLDCGENIYITAIEIIQQEFEEVQRIEEKKRLDASDIGW